MNSAQANKEMVRKAFEVIKALDYNKLDEFVSRDYLRHCQATPDVEVKCLEDFKALLREFDKTFTGVEIRIDMLIAEDDLVAFWGTYSGNQTGPMGPIAATGKRMVSDMGGVHRIENGKIAETWVTWDNLAAFQQLGLNLSQL